MKTLFFIVVCFFSSSAFSESIVFYSTPINPPFTRKELLLLERLTMSFYKVSQDTAQATWWATEAAKDVVLSRRRMYMNRHADSEANIGVRLKDPIINKTQDDLTTK
jgi:hypothetical protein